jgi:predicted RNA-binding protein with PIN domain
MDDGSRSFVSEIASSAGVIGAFAALALGSATLLRWLGVEAPEAPYPVRAVSEPTDPAATQPTLWLVDGFNLLHVTLLRGESREAFWRSAGRDRVVELASRFDADDAEVVVVFDGSQAPQAEAGAGGPRVVFAATADDWLLTAVRDAPDPARVAVVTADRRLAARARHRGAQVIAPGAFAARCRVSLREPAS